MGLLKIYSELWALKNPVFFQETPRAVLYRAEYRGLPAVLKIARSSGLEDEAKACAFLCLCPSSIAVALLESCSDAALMTYLPGPPLSALVKTGEDEQASRILAQTAKAVSLLPVPEHHDFIPLRRWFRALFERAKAPADANDALFVCAASVAHLLLALKTKSVLLHGDLHHDNLLLDHDGRYKMIDPKGLIGHPAYDVANAFCNPPEAGRATRDRIMKQTDIFSSTLGQEIRVILGFGFVHAAISPLWSHEDGEDPGNGMETARLFFDLWQEQV